MKPDFMHTQSSKTAPERKDRLIHELKGELEMHYDEEGYFVRVNWKRER